MIRKIIFVFIITFLFSSVWAEEGDGFSLLVTAENNSRTIHISGFLPNHMLAQEFSLTVIENDGVRINSSYEIPTQEISEFNVNVNPNFSYTFLMTAYDELGQLLVTSETIKNISLGQFSQGSIVPKNSISSPSNRRYKASSSALSGTIDETSCDSFPSISLSAQIKRNGKILGALKEGNFSVLEDGLSPSNKITVIPPKSGGSVRAADFAIVFDHSGSMDDKLRSLRASIGDFVDALKASDISYNLAFIPYERSPIIKQDLTADPQKFLNSVDDFLANWPGGGDENAFKAMQTTVSTLTWRPGAQKVILLFTDEDDDNGGTDLQGINKILTDSNVSVYGIVDKNFGHSNHDFCAAGSVTSATGGRCYSIFSPSYIDVLDDITTTIGQNYIIRYKTSNLDSSSGNRNIELTITDSGETVTTTASYDPYTCAEMDISLAASSVTNKPHRQYQAIPIVAFVNSADPNLVPTVTLFHRHKGNGSYSSVEMSKLTKNTFRGFIAKDTVLDPGVEFYIKAENGRQTITLPSVNAADNPFTIAVLPNKSPVITHKVKSSIPGGKNLLVKANVVDDTTKVARVDIHYLSIEGNSFYKIMPMANTGGDTYEVEIPFADIKGSAIYYYIEAVDDFGVKTTSGRPYFPHITFISTVGYGDKCFTPTGSLLIFCGDKIDEVEDVITLSGNVTIQGRHTYKGTKTVPANDNQPQLSIESAIIIDINKQTVKTKSSGKIRALQYKRSNKSPSEDFVFFDGALIGDFKGKFMPTSINEKSFGIFSQKILQWGANNSSEITLQEDGKLIISGTRFTVGNEYSSLLTIFKLPKEIVLDPEGNSTTASIEIIYSKKPIKITKDIEVTDYLMVIDFLKERVTIGGSVVAKSSNLFPRVGKVNIQKVAAKFVFGRSGYHPFIDGFSIEAGLTEPSSTNPLVWSIPQSPPSLLGIAPTSAEFSMNNFSSDWNVIPPVSLTLKGALVDAALIQQTFKISPPFKAWLISGSLTGTIDSVTTSFVLTGDISFLEAFNLASAKWSFSVSRKALSHEISGAINIPSKLRSILSGAVLQKIHASTNLVSMSGEQQLKVKIPDDIPLVGGFSQEIKVGGNLIASNNDLEKFEFSWIFEILWYEIAGRYDLVSNKLRSRNSSPDILNMSQKYDKGQLTIGGYSSVAKQQKLLNRNKVGKSSKITATVPGNANVVLIRVESDKESALFDLITPDGDIYKLEDATFDPNAPLASKAFFRNNTAAKEGYWALKSPKAGVYELRFRNEAKLGNYTIYVLKQNTKPEIKITSLSSDINANPGEKITIEWNAKDPDDNADIRLYFDTDRVGKDGGLIATGLKEDTVSSFEWTVPDNMYGAFYIYAVIDDGNLGAVTSYSLGKIVLPKAPAPSVPSSLVTTAGDGSVGLAWVLNDKAEKVSAYRVTIREQSNKHENHITVNPDVDKYEFSNLGNGVSYEFAITAINEAGYESTKTTWQSATPTGLSSDGPSDLLVQQDTIAVSLDGSFVNVDVTVENISSFKAYEYTLSCWVGAQDSAHLIGKIKGKNLVGNSKITQKMKFDTLVFPKPIEEMLVCRISDVSIKELNTVNNGMVNTQALKGLFNRSPIAIDDTATTKQNVPVKTTNVLSNDTDADNDTLTISAAGTASKEGGTVVNHNDGTFTYTPKAGFTGTDTFEYTVSDGKGGTDIGTVTITVEKVVVVNNPPKAVDDFLTLKENATGTTENVLANDTDKDGDTLSITAFDALSKEKGVVVNNGNGTFTYTPVKDFKGEDSFTYTISDGKGGTAEGTIKIDVTGECFIATAAFGSYLASDVKVLRHFRDNYLLTNELGQSFVAFYYATSPPIADYIAERNSLRAVTRWALTPVIYSIKYPAGTLLLILLVIIGWRKRHLLLTKRLTQV